MIHTKNPTGAFDSFLPAARQTSHTQPLWTDTDAPLPAIYLSHGAPPLLNEPEWIADLFAWAQAMPKPKGILIISAHWEAAPLSLSAAGPAPNLVYDFGGFHPDYFQLTYPTPDATRLAARVARAMPDHEPIHQHTSRGLDHGAWVPLKVMYPLADVPVLQMSIPTHDPDRLLDIGSRLRELRSEGIAVIGSGFMTHGLPFLTRDMIAGEIPTWSTEFDTWATEQLTTGNIEALADYQTQAPGMPYAHPTPDHYIPLFMTYGAADDPEQAATTIIDGFWIGFSKRSFQL